MGLTHSQRTRLMEQDLQGGEIAPDRSEVVHSFDDGWTINHLATAGDVRREGLLMRSCLAKYAGDELGEERGSITRCERADDDPMRRMAPEDMDILDLGGIHVGCQLMSLRDPMNLPHLTFWHRPGMYACSVLGSHNGKPRASYAARVDQWLAGISEAISTEHDELIYDAMHSEVGRGVIERVHLAVARVGGTRNLLTAAELGRGILSPASTRRQRIAEDLQITYWDKITGILYCLQAAEVNRQVIERRDALLKLGWPTSDADQMRWPGERVQLAWTIHVFETVRSVREQKMLRELDDLATECQLVRWRRWSQRKGHKRAFVRKQ
jgi:hypothetical protein